MKFSFEETELINNFFEELPGIQKSQAIKELSKAIEHTADEELKNLAAATIKKIEVIDPSKFEQLLKDLPLDTFTDY